MAIDARLTLTVYGRNDCHLCEEMIAGLRDLQARLGFGLRVVDVDGDPALERLYGDKVPLLAHGERELCRYALDVAGITAYVREFR